MSSQYSAVPGAGEGAPVGLSPPQAAQGPPRKRVRFAEDSEPAECSPATSTAPQAMVAAAALMIGAALTASVPSSSSEPSAGFASGALATDPGSGGAGADFSGAPAPSRGQRRPASAPSARAVRPRTSASSGSAGSHPEALALEAPAAGSAGFPPPAVGGFPGALAPSRPRARPAGPPGSAAPRPKRSRGGQPGANSATPPTAPLPESGPVPPEACRGHRLRVAGEFVACTACGSYSRGAARGGLLLPCDPTQLRREPNKRDRLNRFLRGFRPDDPNVRIPVHRALVVGDEALAWLLLA